MGLDGLPPTGLQYGVRAGVGPDVRGSGLVVLCGEPGEPRLCDSKAARGSPLGDLCCDGDCCPLTPAGLYDGVAGVEVGGDGNRGSANVSALLPAFGSGGGVGRADSRVSSVATFTSGIRSCKGDMGPRVPVEELERGCVCGLGRCCCSAIVFRAPAEGAVALVATGFAKRAAKLCRPVFKFHCGESESDSDATSSSCAYEGRACDRDACEG
jgi:hypothetical protein